MSFSTVCPGCDARLTAPDSAEGKRIKCKKCGDPFVARPLDDEGDELPERPSVKASTRSRPRPVEDDEDDRPRRPAKATRRDDDDDDRPRRRSRDEDDDDEPRPKTKKGKKKKKAGPPVLLFVLLGVGALLFIVGGAIGAIYYFSKDTKDEVPAAKGGPGAVAAGGPGAAGGNALTAGWVEQHDAKGRYRIKFPTAPRPNPQQVQTPTGQTTVTVYLSGGQNEVFVSGPFPVPADRMGLTDEEILEQGVQHAKVQGRGGNIQSSRNITYQGFAGRELVLTVGGKKSALVMRLILAGDRMIMAMAGGDTASPESPRVKAFFETLKIE